MKFRVRPRTTGDLPRVVGWVPDADALYLFTGPRLHWPLTESQLSDMESGDGFTAWMLVEDQTDDPVGHFDLTLQEETARVGRVILAPEIRGRGFAHDLVDSVIQQARRLGASKLVLNVIAGNAPAIRAYRRADFVLMAESPRPGTLTMIRDIQVAIS
jgi:RimJ/RimL family protein N-acetyltransferase